MDLATFNAGLTNPATFFPQLLRNYKAKHEADAFREYEPEFHKVNNKLFRPDRIKQKPARDGAVDLQGNPVMETTVEPVARIALALQKLIVIRAAAFATGGDMTLNAETPTPQHEELLKAVRAIAKANKLRYKNGPLFKAVCSQLEAAEVWYMDTRKDETGKAIDGKIRCKFYYPADGWDLIPVYDTYGDLIAFAMKYTDVQTNKALMDVYTADYLRKYVFESGAGWVEREAAVKLIYGKIPVVYHSVPKSAWADVQSMIDTAEKILSVYADAIDYNAWPILALLGKVESLPQPGQAGRAIELENGADAKYLNWDTEPAAVTTMIDILMRNIYSITQTPDLNFEAMKGLGDISGVAFKRMLIDAHLKAKDAQEGWYGEGIQRRFNLIMSMYKTVEKQYANVELEIEPEFTLATIDDVSESIENMMKANGGLPIVSHEESIGIANLTADPRATYEAIKAEDEQKQRRAIELAQKQSNSSTSSDNNV